MMTLKRLLPVALMVLLLATGCQPAPAELEFETLTSTDFTVYYTQGDESAAQAVLDVLEANHARITDDLQPAKLDGYEVRIYPDLQELHIAMEYPDAPSWVVGTAWSDTELRMVSPDNPGPSHSYESIMQVAVHEFAHCVTARLAAETGAPARAWLWESIALYEAGQRRSLDDLPYMRTEQYPRFLEMTDPTQSTDIYHLGYSIADYIIQTWGWDGIRDLVLNGGDVAIALEVAEDEFYAGWFDFAKANYLER